MSELRKIIKQISTEKGISEESVYETINSALAAAYRKDFGNKDQNIVAEYDLETSGLKVFDEKIVVENLTPEEVEGIEKLKELREARRVSLEETGKPVEKTDDEVKLEETLRKFNPKDEIEEKAAKEIDKKYKVGDIIRTPLEIPGDFGRMAAQTAKQVIIQKLREAERNVIFEKYKNHEQAILNCIVQKRDGRNVVVDLDNNAFAVMPPQEQIRFEHYNVGDKLKVVLLNVEQTVKGPEIIVSRAHPIFVQKLFETEIPEIANGVITIKAIAREAGSRSKVAVSTDDPNIDPIGSCIGQRGARIQTIIGELNGEKVDIIHYDSNIKKYIGNALMPAKVTAVTVDEVNQMAIVSVPADQLSLTIGRDGQNVRLAVKLTGWKINIKEQESGKEIATEVPAEETAPAAGETLEAEEAKPEVEAKPKKKRATKAKAANEEVEPKEKKVKKTKKTKTEDKE
jgi:N utilization substance protein A